MTTTKMIVGILGAAAAGVALGMLVAPEKGSELRKDIKKTTDDWMNEVSNLVNQGKDYLDRMKHEATDLKQQGEKKATSTANKVNVG